MTLEIRPARPEEMKRLAEVDAIAWAQRPSEEDEDLKDLLPEWTMCAFEEGELATTHAAIPFTMRFNGGKVPVAGVTAVASLPWFRRRGHLRQIMARQFATWYEQGAAPIAILYASMAAIYQRFGYGIVSTRRRYRLDRREIRWAFPRETGGRLRPVGANDLPVLEDLYRRFTAPRTGPLHRTPRMWERGPLNSGRYERGRVLALVYEEGGTPEGYLIYSVADEPPRAPGPHQTVYVREIVWHTPAAYRAFWDFLAYIDLAREVRAFPMPPDDPLFDLLLEPRLLTPTIYDGLLGRLVDLPRALAARPYPEEAVLTFRVLDDLCPWNARTWRLETGPGEARAVPTRDAPQLTVPVDVLAKLLFGALPASRAARMGRLEAHDPSALPAWDRTLRTDYPPFCMDHF